MEINLNEWVPKSTFFKNFATAVILIERRFKKANNKILKSNKLKIFVSIFVFSKI